MGYQDTERAKDKKGKPYCFARLPENIRQMGEQPKEGRVYIEDYVVTYMRQVFREKQEQAVVVLVGKLGEGEAEGVRFVYGAMEIELDIMEGNDCFRKETWDKIYELLYQHFQGAEILGWGCGVSMWSSRVERVLLDIQKQHFSKEGMLFFLEDLTEKEQRLYEWKGSDKKELSGYAVYYEKNPQMQEFMLRGQPKESFEESYRDRVTSDVRAVIQRKEERKNTGKLAVYSAGAVLVLLTLLGANLLVQSTRKIDSLERTIETLSNAAAAATAPPEEKKKVEKALEPKVEEMAAEQEKPAIPSPKDRPSASPAATASPSPAPTPKPTAKAKKQEEGDREPSAQTVQSERTMESYVVRAGDTLSQIVWKQYHTLSCMEMVKKANNITNGDKIREGQTILLPKYRKSF